MIMNLLKKMVDFCNKTLSKIYACESACSKKYSKELEKLYSDNKNLIEWWKMKYYNEKSEEAPKKIYGLLKQQHDIMLKLGFFKKKEK